MEVELILALPHLLLAWLYLPLPCLVPLVLLPIIPGNEVSLTYYFRTKSVLYHFTLPIFMPQLLAWIRLQNKASEEVLWI